MPRSKEGKKRSAVVKENIECAVMAVINGEMSLRQACADFTVKLGTLHRHIEIHKQSGSDVYKYEATNAVKQVFNITMEEELLDYIKQAALLHYGLTKWEIRELAYQYAKANKVKYPQQWDENQTAGGEWMRNFMKKHEASVALRKPEATSLARSTSFNKFNVQAFFKNVKTVLEKHGPFPAHQIYNVDETGLSTVHVPPKIVAPKGIKQLGSMTSGERGQNVTMIAAINAVGNHIPPMFVFPRVNFKDFMLTGAPVGSIGGANPSGWSNESLFLKFLDHFIQHAKPSKEEPILMFLDNHDSHVNIPVIEKARASGIIMITFPPHTSHKLQPLDRTVFGSFKMHYNRAMNNWMSSNPGKSVSVYDVAQLVGRAFPLAFTTSNILSGFSATGISPLNEDIFQEDEFLSSYVSDRPDPALNPGERHEPLQLVSKPSTSEEPTISPVMIRPFPKALPRKGTSKGRAKGKSRILTDTPNKEEIAAQKTSGISKKKKPVKRKLIIDDSGDECEQVICQDSSYKEVSVQEILEQDAEDKIEENAIAVGMGEKSMKYVLPLKSVVRAVGQFVAVTYDNELYPGKIINVNDDGATISSMTKSKKSWKWPEKEDIIIYPWEDILGGINSPRQISKRGFFHVPELNSMN
ncbi:uncharacterized protein LOC124161317 [Ischnura elegans]|uniref:uncharacterized protein LOC124161317 n=1 Tax=Ischnura elegans TaxID=197161 RepID=UPI001ED89FBF|nr:uncharacterized protein LOC124161317 [Ischnura elegans]